MMKKALFTLLLVAVFTPFTFAQRVIVPTSVAACQTYTWSVTGETYTADTMVTFANATNDTLFILDLTINQPGNFSETIVSNRCTYTWRNQSVIETGIYYDTVHADATAGTCEATYMADITIPAQEIDTIAASVCGEYVWNGDTITENGSYFDTIASTANCNHIDRLNLLIVSTINTLDTVAVCGSYLWYDSTYTVSGNHTVHSTDAERGCDTIHNLNLTILVDTADVLFDSACAQKVWYGDTLTATNVYTIYDTNASNQCVTIRTLNLKIKQPRANTADTVVTGCNTVVFRISNFYGEVTKRFTESTSFDTLFTDHRWAQCYDSTINLTVNVNQSHRDTVVVKACDSYYWPLNKTTYTKVPSTMPRVENGKDSNNCDSVMCLSLTIQKSPVIAAINGEWNLNAGDTAKLWPSCTDGATYNWHYGNKSSNADTLIIPNVQGNIDVDLVATINYPADNYACSDTSWITIVTWVGINEVNGTNVSLYPNPTVGQLNIESVEAVSEVAIYNSLGQQVAINYNLGTNAVMNLSNLSKGAYTMRLKLQNGESITRKFIITK